MIEVSSFFESLKRGKESSTVEFATHLPPVSVSRKKPYSASNVEPIENVQFYVS